MKPVVESQTRHRLTFSTTTAEANLKYPTCEETQDVENYQIFTKMSVSDRAGLKVKEDCCFRCLWPGHQGVNCERSERSGQEDSNGRHHFLLHGVTPQFPKRSVNTTTVSSNEDMYLESWIPQTKKAESFTPQSYPQLIAGSRDRRFWSSQKIKIMTIFWNMASYFHIFFGKHRLRLFICEIISTLTNFFHCNECQDEILKISGRSDKFLGQ